MIGFIPSGFGDLQDSLPKQKTAIKKLWKFQLYYTILPTQNFITEMKPWRLRFQRNSLMK